MGELNRYEIPVPAGYDGESITMCDDCRADCPDHLVGEWLEDKPRWHGCDGIPGGEGCKHGNGEHN